VESLEGLEALEQVGNLELRNVGVEDLTALSGLTRVIWDPPGSGDGGVLSISDSPNLRHLGGLQRLSSWQRLYVASNPQLVTLGFLSGPPSVTEVALYDLPQLDDLSLGFLRAAETVSIDGTALQDLSGMPLAQAEHLAITNNPLLESLEVPSLLSVGTLSVADNPLLLRVELPQLEEVHAIRIVNNASLLEVPLYETSSFTSLSIGDEPIVRLSEQSFEVSNNPLLTRVALPETFEAVQQVVIWDNPQLSRLDLNDLARADGLTISDNPALTQVLAGSLERVGDLEVLNNPSLSMAPFADVQTFSSSIRGNLDDPLTQPQVAPPAAESPAAESPAAEPPPTEPVAPPAAPPPAPAAP
jgi:hypothetical protein